ncbi:histidine phosphatase family protein [Candidatus Enterococcus mansonii]|uniref:Phosphoglycerate mutase n=1 Tax=Candidatus Enterococcus mansonii TaxID=1834181 RepID=A0A242CK41_9ENTE|nr:histidine phosphatase family protein [Enterococcus sp. 4G2_DIV0659]OTO10606.1 hypothetical protein A5880_001290 [Enterococcus sp. 4G2_DIV0659]
MNKIDFYIIRHGKTNVNLENKIQGSTNDHLTPEGRRDIEELATIFKRRGILFDVSFTSDSYRALETGDILLKEFDFVNQYVNEKLGEWNFGSLENQDIDDTIQAFIGESKSGNLCLDYNILADYIVSKDQTRTTETWTEICNRIQKAFQEIAIFCQNKKFDKILVVSHGLTISTFLQTIDFKYSFMDIPSNGEVVIVNYDNDFFL